jgi:hypothetical protein
VSGVSEVEVLGLHNETSDAAVNKKPFTGAEFLYFDLP